MQGKLDSRQRVQHFGAFKEIHRGPEVAAIHGTPAGKVEVGSRVSCQLPGLVVG